MKYIKLTGFSAVSHENVTYSATDDVFEVPDELGATMVAWGGNEVAKPLSAEELAANLAAAAAAKADAEAKAADEAAAAAAAKVKKK